MTTMASSGARCGTPRGCWRGPLAMQPNAELDQHVVRALAWGGKKKKKRNGASSLKS
jgi:hypothetical protein